MQTNAEKIILQAVKRLPKNEVEFNALKRVIWKQFSGAVLNKTELLKAYHNLVKNKSIKPNKTLQTLLTRRAVRSLSGVAIITSLTKPYPCPGECVYCPLDARMPKSYLAEEPAASRALTLKFSPYEQMYRRILALEANGHPTDKIELIIKGGTWNAYPLAYQYWFVLESFRAANGDNQKNKKTSHRHSGAPPRGGGKQKINANSNVAKIKIELFKQQKINEASKHRIIGLTIETRPDCINEKTIWQLREQGCTRVEMGVQHTSDRILKLIKRGHNLMAAITATKLLKNFGFKTDFHLMPMLPGATPAQDFAMLKKIFSNENLRPDMIKIYPCTVIKNSKLYEWYKNKKYRAYSTKKLINILIKFKTTVPRYCRISRLIRDIPGQLIQEGNTTTNLRQVIQTQMKAKNLKCNCLRCREIGHQSLPLPTGEGGVRVSRDLTPRLFVDKYEASDGIEYFISYEDKLRQVVFAFCRLRVTNLADAAFTLPPSEGGSRGSAQRALPGGMLTNNAAIIRELHTYGQLIAIKQKNKKTKKLNDRDVQHTGLGKKLVLEAERIAKKNKASNIAVIAGVGVRGYYRRLGYKLYNTYLVKNFKKC